MLAFIRLQAVSILMPHLMRKCGVMCLMAKTSPVSNNRPTSTLHP